MPITDRHPEYQRFAGQWRRVRDAVSGGDAIKKAGTAYLPRPDGMSGETSEGRSAYEAYRFRARWYDVTERTKRGLVGVMFGKDPVLTLPERLRGAEDRPLEILDTLPASAKSFQVFLRQSAGELVTVGRRGILVDLPEEAPVGTLPFWAAYEAETIINWDQIRIAGRFVVSRAVLEEPDETASREPLQYRELILIDGVYRVNIWRKADQQKEFVIAETATPTRNGRPLDFIPFVFIGVDDLDPDVEKPPLLGLTDENIGHYQLSADLRQSLFLTAQPTPWVTGFQTDEVPTHVGSGALWASANQEANVGMLEFQGAGIGAIRQEMQDAENRMVLLGARFFERNKSGVEAAETMRLRFGADNATLTTIAQTLGSGIQMALRWTADWAGISGDIKVEMNTEFLAQSVTVEELKALLQTWQAGGIAFGDFVGNLKRGGFVDEDRTPQQIQAERETTPPTDPLLRNEAVQ